MPADSSAVSAIGTQMRDPVNLGLTRWRINGRRRGNREKSRKHQIQPEYGDEQADAGRTAEPVSRDQILRRERGKGNINFPCSADHEQDGQPYRVDPYSCYMCNHTYLLQYRR